MTGTELRRLRGKLTHEELAARVGVNRTTILRQEQQGDAEMTSPALALAVLHVVKCGHRSRKLRAAQKGAGE